MRRLVLAAAALPFAPARAAALPDALYTATAIVTGYDMRSRPAGFARCLREVLVKLTGDPAISEDERIPADAAPYVAQFSYFDPIAHRRPHDDQGSYDRSYDLTVNFDRGKVDALAASLGRRLWTADRPVMVPVVRMHGTARPWQIDLAVTADDPAAAPQRTALSNAGERYGVSVRFVDAPLFGQLEQAPDPPRPGAMVFIGALEWTPEAFGWSGSWRSSWMGRALTASVRGVSFDEAFDRMVRGGVQVAAGTGSFG